MGRYSAILPRVDTFLWTAFYRHGQRDVVVQSNQTQGSDVRNSKILNQTKRKEKEEEKRREEKKEKKKKKKKK